MIWKEDLTPKERQLIDRIVGEYKQALLSKELHREAFEDGVQWLYEKLLQLPKPQVIYCSCPTWKPEINQQSKKINRLAVQNALNRYRDDLIWRADMRIMEKKKNRFVRSMLLENLYAHHDETVLEIVNRYRKNGINLKKQLEELAYFDFCIQSDRVIDPDFSSLKKLCYSGIYHIFLWKDVVFAVVPPIIRQDEHAQLHSTIYPAIEWPGGPKAYYIYGREVPEWIFTQYGTKNLYHRFLREDNEDIRSAIITLIKEREGSEGVFHFLKAELVDEKEIVHFSGYKEVLRLYKSKEKFDFLQNRHGESEQPYCWSEFTCPSTGSTYLIDNSADFTDAVEAAKFLRPSFIPRKFTYRWVHDAS